MKHIQAKTFGSEIVQGPVCAQVDWSGISDGVGTAEDFFGEVSNKISAKIELMEIISPTPED